MQNYIYNFSNSIFSFHRYSKRLIATICDVILCILCTWMAFAVRSEYWLAIKPEIDKSILLQDFSFNSLLISILIAIPVFWLFGLYRTIFRYTGFSIFFTILMSSFVYGILYFTIAVYGVKAVPRPIGFFQPMLLFLPFSLQD